MPTRTEHVIALDPGHRTGWASAHMTIDKMVLSGSGVYEQDVMARTLAEAQVIRSGMLMGSVIKPEFDVITAESWRPRRKNGSMNWIENDRLLSAQHVGQIRLIAMLSGARYIEQAPSLKDTYRSSYPQVLRALDAESSELHDQDARLHLWGYFFNNWFTTKVDPEKCVVL